MKKLIFIILKIAEISAIVGVYYLLGLLGVHVQMYYHYSVMESAWHPENAIFGFLIILIIAVFILFIVLVLAVIPLWLSVNKKWSKKIHKKLTKIN
jgi:heme/copper-type cytochrome/quinol oxidase subunit 2